MVFSFFLSLCYDEVGGWVLGHGWRRDINGNPLCKIWRLLHQKKKGPFLMYKEGNKINTNKNSLIYSSQKFLKLSLKLWKPLKNEWSQTPCTTGHKMV